MLESQINRNSTITFGKIIIILLLPTLATTAIGTILISDTATTSIQSPSGSSIQYNAYW